MTTHARVQSLMWERWSRSVAIAVGITLFVGGAFFLVKTPHLSLAFNSVFVVCFLAATYVYVRNRFDLRIPVVLLALVVLALEVDALGNYFHLYGTNVGPIRYDELAHLLVQALATPVVVWIARRWCEQADVRVPTVLVSFSAASAMFSLSAFYEVLELWDERVFGGQRIWSLHDTAEDLQWDLCGIVLGVVLAHVVLRVKAARGA